MRLLRYTGLRDSGFVGLEYIQALGLRVWRVSGLGV